MLCEKVVRIVDGQGSRGTTVVVHSFAGSLRGGNLYHSSAFRSTPSCIQGSWWKASPTCTSHTNVPSMCFPPWLPPKNHPRCHPIRGIQARLNTSLPVQRLNDGPEVAVRTDSEFRPVGVTPTVLRFFFLPVFFDEAHLSKTRIGVARRSFARRRKQGPCRLVRARKET